MDRILFFDSKSDYDEELSSCLGDRGITVEFASTVTKGLKKFMRDEYALVIVSDNLMDFDAKSLVSLLRESNEQIDIAVVSSDNSDDNQIQYLQMGVREFLPDKLSFAVMCERIIIILEKAINNKDRVSLLTSTKENLKMNVADKALIIEDQFVHLSFIEFDILEYLLRNKNRTITRDDFLREIWKITSDEATNDPRTVDAYIKNIRKKTSITSIKTIRSVGYQWIELE